MELVLVPTPGALLDPLVVQETRVRNHARPLRGPSPTANAARNGQRGAANCRRHRKEGLEREDRLETFLRPHKGSPVTKAASLAEKSGNSWLARFKHSADLQRAVLPRSISSQLIDNLNASMHRDRPVFEHLPDGGFRAGDYSGAADGGSHSAGVPGAAQMAFVNWLRQKVRAEDWSGSTRRLDGLTGKEGRTMCSRIMHHACYRPSQPIRSTA